MVTITDYTAITFKITAPAPLGLAQTATFGNSTPAGSGGWRPQLDDYTVEDLVSYDSLLSGSLGSHTPSISSGRLVFSGAAGGPNGAVLRCTGASGRLYDVTIASVANRRDIATDADVSANKSVGANLGLTIVIRQNAQIPRRTRLTAGRDWISGVSQGEMDSGLTSPITLMGEGPVLPGEPGFAESVLAGEYHIHSIRSFFPSGTEIKRLRWADQKTDDSLIHETNASRTCRNITFRENYFNVHYDVDVVGNWSTGFGSTGYHKASQIWITNDYTSDATFIDNVFIGGYRHTNIVCNGTLWYVGNYHSSPYFDYRNTSFRTAARPECVRIEGGNYYTAPKVFSVNETTATEPHLDADQAYSGSQVNMTYDEARIVWHTTSAGLQPRFHANRPSSTPTGNRFSFVGDMVVGATPQAVTNGYPDNMVMDRLFVLPNFVPAPTVPGNTLRIFLGANLAGEGGDIGTHQIKNSTYGGIDYMANPPVNPANVIKTNVSEYATQNAAYFAARLARWSDWGSLPVEPTMAEAYTYFEPVAASDFDGKSPYGLITIGSPKLSDYTISDTLRPVPNLSALTVTNTSTAAFTVVTDITTNSTVHWAVFTSEVTDPQAILKGISGTTAALSYGIAHRGNSAGTITSAGGSALSNPGATRWLCVAQYNGPKKVDVITTSFVVT